MKMGQREIPDVRLTVAILLFEELEPGRAGP